MKYIDSEKLIAEIERRLKSLHEWKTGWERKLPLSRNKTYYKNFGKESAYDAILNIITSLQQEQPEVDFEKEENWLFNHYGWECLEDMDTVVFAKHFYELGYRHAAVLYDDIEFERQRREEKDQPQGLNKPRDCGKGIHKQEYTGCDMSWMDEWKYASKGLDEAAEEFARTTFTQPYSEAPEKEITIIEPDKLAGFKAGAKWMAEQGVTKECPIGLATEEIYCNITEKTLDELGICPGDNVIIQIRKKE